MNGTEKKKTLQNIPMRIIYASWRAGVNSNLGFGEDASIAVTRVSLTLKPIFCKYDNILLQQKFGGDRRICT